MIGTQFRVNTNFFYTVKDKNNKRIGRGKIAENTTITIIDTQIRNGVRWCKLDHSIGWVGSNNRIWKRLESLIENIKY